LLKCCRLKAGELSNGLGPSTKHVEHFAGFKLADGFEISHFATMAYTFGAGPARLKLRVLRDKETALIEQEVRTKNRRTRRRFPGNHRRVPTKRSSPQDHLRIVKRHTDAEPIVKKSRKPLNVADIGGQITNLRDTPPDTRHRKVANAKACDCSGPDGPDQRDGRIRLPQIS